MIQPSSVRSVSSVIFGSVLPYCSWPALPIGNSCHSRARPVLAAAAFITLTASGTTSRPMSSPSRIPIFIWLSDSPRHARLYAGHPRLSCKQGVDGRDKPGHDERWVSKSLIHLDAGVGDVAPPGLHLLREPGAGVVGGLVVRRGQASLLENGAHLRRL